MSRFAVFIDAGYLKRTCASFLSCDSREISIDFEQFSKVCIDICYKETKKDLLRFYWYDGAIPGALMNSEHQLISRLKNFRLRLGQLRRNPNGEYRQKGVDGLIVTDLLMLSQNRALSDAFLVSGDEDLCVGIMPSQNFGVRIHILNTSVENTVSPHLIEEIDTQLFFSNEDIKKFCFKKVENESIKRNDIDPENLVKSFLEAQILSDEEFQQLKESKPYNIPKNIDTKIISFLRGIENPFPKDKLKQFRYNLIKSLLEKNKNP